VMGLAVVLTPCLVDRYGAGWNMAEVAQFIVFNLNHDECLAKDVERELVEEYRAALISQPGFPEEDAARLTSEVAYQEFVVLYDGTLQEVWMALMWRCLCRYLQAVVFLCMGDMMTWMEQRRFYEEGRRGVNLFSSPRMAELAPQITTGFAQALVRNNILETVLPRLVAPAEKAEASA